MKISKLIIASIVYFLTISITPSFASEEKHGEKNFNAGELIMEHIADEHGWHLWGHTTLPLPVILYNSDRGLSVFSSSKFEHGHMAYAGYRLNEKGKVEAINETGEVPAEMGTINEAISANTYDLSITKNVLSIFVTMTILMLVFLSVAKSYTKRKGLAPQGLQNAVESIVIFMRDDVIKAGIGEKKYEKYVPYLLTLFFFIWINNLLGLIPVFPGGANVTGNISVALVLATLTFIITTISGNKNYWQHIFAMPGVPKGVLVLLTPIEILGVFLRPFVLMIRLFANIAAGHIIALSFFCLIFIFGQETLYGTGGGLGVSPLSIVFTVFMGFLELLVAFLQAYVFTLLSSIYIGAAVEEHHHDDHH
ncbi:MAG: F0F1 ATP synthase subunit A [Bacteroidota bacterium]